MKTQLVKTGLCELFMQLVKNGLCELFMQLVKTAICGSHSLCCSNLWKHLLVRAVRCVVAASKPLIKDTPSLGYFFFGEINRQGATNLYISIHVGDYSPRTKVTCSMQCKVEYRRRKITMTASILSHPGHQNTPTKGRQVTHISLFKV